MAARYGAAAAAAQPVAGYAAVGYGRDYADPYLGHGIGPMAGYGVSVPVLVPGSVHCLVPALKAPPLFPCRACPRKCPLGLPSSPIRCALSISFGCLGPIDSSVFLAGGSCVPQRLQSFRPLLSISPLVKAYRTNQHILILLSIVLYFVCRTQTSTNQDSGAKELQLTLT